jgi:hypothetical protein
MFNFGKKNKAPDITSLKLEVPERPASQQDAVSGKVVGDDEFRKRYAEVRERVKNSPAVDEVSRRAKKILESGKFPEMFFVGAPSTGGGLIVLNTPDQKKMIPIFSSGALATDYMRTRIPNARVGAFKTADLSSAALQWYKGGIHRFALDSCPRCDHVQTFDLKETPPTQADLMQVWATLKATRDWRTESIVRELFDKNKPMEVPQKLASLIFLRDHVDCGIPYVHWLIGILAEMQGDAGEKAVAAARLDEFGPEFRGKLDIPSGLSEAGPWTESVARAHVGLLASAGLLDMAKISGGGVN